jgi:ribosomal protein S18 acetylase RimI-like enzyme
VTLGVYEHNTAARALYADVGFVEAGERQRRVVDGREWVSLELVLVLSRG